MGVSNGLLLFFKFFFSFYIHHIVVSATCQFLSVTFVLRSCLFTPDIPEEFAQYTASVYISQPREQAAKSPQINTTVEVWSYKSRYVIFFFKHLTVQLCTGTEFTFKNSDKFLKANWVTPVRLFATGPNLWNGQLNGYSMGLGIGISEFLRSYSSTDPLPVIFVPSVSGAFHVQLAVVEGQLH